MIKRTIKDIYNETAPPSIGMKLVIVSNFTDTLKTADKVNSDLLRFLCDAHLGGHRVIITDDVSTDDLTDQLQNLAAQKTIYEMGFAMLGQFETMTKSELMAQTAEGDVAVDVTFDLRSLNDQDYAYASPHLEVTVDENFQTFPVTMNGVRSFCRMCYASLGKPDLKEPELA